MTIVLAGAAGDLAAALTERLAPDHAVSALTDWGDGTVDALKAALPEGLDALVNLAGIEPPVLRGLDADAAAMDSPRLTWNLIEAARAAGCRRFLQLSSLALFAEVDPDLIVSESFVPVPTTDPRRLGWILSERVCREAATELPHFHVVVVRLGRLVREEAVAGQPYDPLWVDVRDAAAVLARLATIESSGGGFGRHTVHVCADRPDALSPPRRLRRWLDVQMEHDFGYSAATARAGGQA